MNIKKTLLAPDKLKPLYADALKLPFGRTFTDYFFTMEYHRSRAGMTPRSSPTARSRWTRRPTCSTTARRCSRA